MKPKVLLNTYSRTIEHLFTSESFARLDALTDLVWAKDEDASEDVIEECRDDNGKLLVKNVQAMLPGVGRPTIKRIFGV